MVTLDRLLEPIARSTFLADYWSKKAAYLPDPGHGTRFAALPSLDQLPSVLSGRLTEKTWLRGVSQAFATIPDGAGGTRNLGYVPIGLFEQLYNAGASLCIGPLPGNHDKLLSVGEGVAKESPPGATAISCYITPPHSGSPMHFDCQNVFFCQVSGRKLWRYSTNPAAYYPPTNIGNFPGDDVATAGLRELGVSIASPDACEFSEVVLNEGDVLYLPPGTWHEPRTLDRHSLHYTLTLFPHGFLHALFPVVRMLALANPAWRTDLRFFEEANGGAPLAGFLQARLDELREAMAGLTGDSLLARASGGVTAAGRLQGLFSIP